MNSATRSVWNVFKRSSQGVDSVSHGHHHRQEQWRGIRVKVFNGNLESALTFMQRKMQSSGIERMIKHEQTHHIKNSEKRVLARKNLERRIKSQDLARKLKAILSKKVRGLWEYMAQADAWRTYKPCLLSFWSIMANTALSFCTAIVVFIDKFIDSAFSQGKKLMFHLKNVTSKASILSLSGVWVALSKLKSKLSISCHLKWFRVTRYIGIDPYGSARSLYSMRNSTTSVNWKFKSKLNSLSVVLWNTVSINQRRSQTKKYSTKVLEVAEAH